MTRFTLRGIAFAAGIALISSTALAADPPSTPPDPTPAQRQQMAAVHRKMAECLASERPFTECRNEMHSGCAGIMGGQGCPMMGMMGGGMMHGRGMMGGQTPAPAPPAPPAEN